MNHKIIKATCITPEYEERSFREYIYETDAGFFWVSDGCRSTDSFSSFLDAIRFAMNLRHLEAERMVTADEIVGEVEAQLAGRASISRGELAKWIGEFRQSCRTGSPGWCEIRPGEFLDWRHE